MKYSFKQKQVLEDTFSTFRQDQNKSYSKYLPLKDKDLFQNDKVSISKLRNHLNKEIITNISLAKKIVKKCRQILQKQPNLVRPLQPIQIIGDIHGQFSDLLTIMANFNPKSNYLFLGDYVDRGNFSVEVILLLFAYKINYPSRIYLLRGNHQSRNQTERYNFRRQCLYKYNQEFYNDVMECFDTLPLAALISGKILCLHAGISPNIRSLKDIEKIDRFREIPEKGALCDIVWSDPIRNLQGLISNKQQYANNQNRNCSYFYGREAVSNLFQKEDLVCIIRAHEPFPEGYKFNHWFGLSTLPAVITIFSAPNYCKYGNKSCTLRLNNNLIELKQYQNSLEHFLLPNNIDIFNFTIPFLFETVNLIAKNILKRTSVQKQITNTLLKQKIEKMEQFINSTERVVKKVCIEHQKMLKG